MTSPRRWSALSAPRWPIPSHSFGFTLLLGLITVLPPLAIDMGLPALGAIGAALGHDAADATLTLSLFMLGFATAPLAYGPLSDRFGRRPVTLWAIALFALAGVGCTFADSLTSLLVWRLIQGAGAGASLVIPLAIVRDLFEGFDARAKLSQLMVLTIMAPMVAPTLGALVLSVGGWRAIYGILAIAGVIAVIGMTLGFAESAKIDPNRRLNARQLLRDYGRVLRHRESLGYLLVASCAFGIIFGYVSASPLLMIDVMGISPGLYGLVFAGTSLGIMAGAFLNGRLARRGIAIMRPMAGGLALAVVCSLILLGLAFTGAPSLPLLVPFLVLATFGCGLVFPNAAHGVVQPVPDIAGSASALMGCLQMVVGAISSAMVAWAFDGRTAIAMTGVMAFFAVLAAISMLLIVRPASRTAEAASC